MDWNCRLEIRIKVKNLLYCISIEICIVKTASQSTVNWYLFIHLFPFISLWFSCALCKCKRNENHRRKTAILWILFSGHSFPAISAAQGTTRPASHRGPSCTSCQWIYGTTRPAGFRDNSALLFMRAELYRAGRVVPGPSCTRAELFHTPQWWCTVQ